MPHYGLAPTVERHYKFSKCNLSDSVSSHGFGRRYGTYRSGDTILITNVGSKHVPNGFFIAERYIVPFIDKIEGSIPNVFEPFCFDSLRNASTDDIRWTTNQSNILQT
jgi:hypothetical protein